jgi:hypothetical protein
MYYVERPQFAGNTTYLGAWRGNGTLFPTIFDFFPRTPVITGILVDTLVFGLVAALIIVIFAYKIVGVRIRAGVCPLCKYNTRYGTGCPECGWTTQ